MVSIRIHSIQDIIKNINRRLTFYDIFALLVLALLLLLLSFIIKGNTEEIAISYKKGAEESSIAASPPSVIFGSISGKTYTYSWCQGAGRIKDVNKIFFQTEEEAKRSGRTLSKLCK